MALEQPFGRALGEFAGPMAPVSPQGLINQALAEGQMYLQRGVAQALHEAVEQSGERLAESTRTLDKVLQRGLLGPITRLEIHRDVGRRAQNAVLNSYSQSFKPNWDSGYRSGAGSIHQRYSGGKLKAALADPSFYKADASGLDFINIELLDRRAAQWMRLNFGAGGLGKGSLRPQQLRIGSLVVGAMGLNENARPAFTIPYGVFFRGRKPIEVGEQGTSFYPGGTGPTGRRTPVTQKVGNRKIARIKHRRDDVDNPLQGGSGSIPWVKPQITKGIRGRNFLDRGIPVIVDQNNGLLAQYQRATADGLKTSKVSFRQQAITVTPRRP